MYRKLPLSNPLHSVASLCSQGAAFRRAYQDSVAKLKRAKWLLTQCVQHGNGFRMCRQKQRQVWETQAERDEVLQRATDFMEDVAAILKKHTGSHLPTPEVTYECLDPGEMDDPETLQEACEQAGRRLDKAHAHEILGDNIWKGSDGYYYSWQVEAEFVKLDPEYAANRLADLEEE